jgi:multidrug efflux pump subunit AcrA (membrane-fusion protein)
MKKFYQIFAAVVIMIIGGFFLMELFASMAKEKPKEKPVTPKRYVEAAPVNFNDYMTNIVASGRVMSAEQVNLSSEVQGRITEGEVSLRKGTSFKKGQVLVRIINPENTYNLKSQKSNFLNLLANALADLKLDYKESYNTWYDFFVSITVEDPLPELPKIKDEQLKIFLSSRNILGNYYSIKSFEERVKKQIIIAPFDGNFTSVNLQEGSVANPGSIIGTIINTSFYEVEVPIEKNDIRWLKKGQPVKVIAESGYTDTLKGKIHRIAQFIDMQTQTIPVYVRIPSVQGLTFEGDYYNCIFDDIKVKNSMEILRSAVFNHNEVFLVKEGKLVKHTININKVAEKTLFFNGVPEGDTIVTEALINANENMSVEIYESKKQ